VQTQETKKLFAAFPKNTLFFVGGVVRDFLLQKPCVDIDLATPFEPLEVVELLDKHNIFAIPTGLIYGTITASINGRQYQITSFRKDIKTDGRYAEVEFGGTMLEDSIRRDFTINAMYMDEGGKVYDFHDGQKDLLAKKIRFIGLAEARIKEDYLRILRLFRFDASYGSGILPQDLELCYKLADGLKFVSKERQTSELLKILTTGKNIFAAGFVLGGKVSLDKVYTSNPIAILAAIHLKDGVKTDLALSNKQQLELDELIKIYNNHQSDNHILYHYGNARFIDLLFLQKTLKEVDITNRLEYANNFIKKPLPITGDDLLKRGLKGKEVGDELTRLTELWIANNFSL
jgi:poly(A) polymerase